MAFSTRPTGRPGTYRPTAEINVTPLVDVMLVLLIIFIITAPMLSAGLRVDLPQARAGETLNPKEPIVVTIAREGKLMLGGVSVELSALAGTIRREARGESRLVQLRGDREVAYGEVVAIIDHLATNGIVKVAFMTAPAR